MVAAVLDRELPDEHMRLVAHIARRVHSDVGAHVELDDLIAWGTTGLLEATQRYDPELGAAFSTFAHYRVHGAIYDGLRKMGALPRHLYHALKPAQRGRELLENLGAQHAGSRAHEPAPSTADRVRALHRAMRTLAVAYITLHGADAATRPDDERADAQLSRKQLLARLDRAVAALPARERHFITRCYFEEKTLAEAGQELGLSRSWSSRLHARALDRLRDMLGDE